MRALVFGASGHVATYLVPHLAQHGDDVRAAARSRAVLEARAWPDVELVEADALAPETLPAALADVDVAYYLVHSMTVGRDFGRVDVSAAANFRDAAAAAGVGRIVYLGGLIPSDAQSEHLLSRRDVGRVLREGPVPVTELRAGIIVSPGSAAFEVIRDVVNHLPLILAPRWMRLRSPPIAMSNLLAYLVAAAGDPRCAGRTFDVAGPDSLSYADLVHGYGRAVGRRPAVVTVPLLTPRLFVHGLGLVSAVPTRIARALVAGLRSDIVADDAAIRRIVPQRLLDYEEAVRAALAAEREAPPAARYVEGRLNLRGGRAQHAYYSRRARVTTLARATPAQVWRTVVALGGDNRYYALDWLWTLREWLDRLVGGPRRGPARRDPEHIEPGDTIDAWRVAGVDAPRRLTLLHGRRAPGSEVMEIEVAPHGGAGARVTVTTYWHPAGIWGLLYWYLLSPLHRILLPRMVRGIARHAEASGGNAAGTGAGGVAQ